MPARVLSQDEINQIAAQNQRYLSSNPGANTGGYAPYQAPAAGQNTFLPERTLAGGPDTSGTSAGQAPTNAPNLGSRIMDLLLQSQRMGTAKFKTASLNLQDQQADRTMSTPSSLIGASPSQQASVRNTSANALNPSIQGAESLGQTFGEQLNSFGNQVKTVNDYLTSEATRMDKERQDARTIVQNALTTFGSKGFDIIDPKYIKLAGYDETQLEQAKNTLKEQEMAQKYASGSIGEYQFAKQNGYTGSFSDYQNEDANRKAKATGLGGLTANQVNSTVNQIAGAFDNEPIVKNYNTVQQGYNTISKIGANTKSPADDIAFIYAFAKIMDPESVVREGEYDTIQKYGQSWATAFGFKANRIFSNTNFLSADAKQKMLNTLKPKVDTITTQYTNLKKQYDSQVAGAYSGQPRQITDYAAGNQPSASGENDPLGVR